MAKTAQTPGKPVISTETNIEQALEELYFSIQSAETAYDAAIDAENEISDTIEKTQRESQREQERLDTFFQRVALAERRKNDATAMIAFQRANGRSSVADNTEKRLNGEIEYALQNYEKEKRAFENAEKGRNEAIASYQKMLVEAQEVTEQHRAILASLEEEQSRYITQRGELRASAIREQIHQARQDYDQARNALQSATEQKSQAESALKAFPVDIERELSEYPELRQELLEMVQADERRATGTAILEMFITLWEALQRSDVRKDDVPPLWKAFATSRNEIRSTLVGIYPEIKQDTELEQRWKRLEVAYDVWLSKKWGAEMDRAVSMRQQLRNRGA